MEKELCETYVASVASAGQSGSKSEESGVDLHVVGWLVSCLFF